MKAVILALSAILGVTACNRQAKRDAKETGSDASAKTAEESRQTQRDVKEGTDTASGKAKEEARQTNRDVKEGAAKAKEGTRASVDSMRSGGREASGGVKEGAGSAADKVRGEARRVSNDVKGALHKDDGKSEADKKLTSRIRSSLEKDKKIPASERDVNIRTEDGSVVLSGTVASKETKTEIVRDAQKVAGKAKVKDEIKVAERVGTGNTD